MTNVNSLQWTYKLFRDSSDNVERIDQNLPGICEMSVRRYPPDIQYIREPTDELIRLAVTLDPLCIQFIDKPSEELCKLALKGNPFSIANMTQTPELCMYAVELDVRAVCAIDHVAPEVWKYVLERDVELFKFIKEQTPDMCMYAVTHSPDALQFVDEQTVELCVAAVTAFPSAGQYVAPELTGEVMQRLIAGKSNKGESSKSSSDGTAKTNHFA